MKFGKAVVKHRVVILVIALVLLIPSIIGMACTRINYDMLTYLPGDLDTVTGQDILMDDFGKGAFSFVIVEGMPNKDVAALKERIGQLICRGIEYGDCNGVDTIFCYHTSRSVCGGFFYLRYYPSHQAARYESQIFRGLCVYLFPKRLIPSFDAADKLRLLLYLKLNRLKQPQEF